MSLGVTLRLIPTRGGLVYECPECEERFLPALADSHACHECTPLLEGDTWCLCGKDIEE